MDYYASLDVSLEETSVCVVDGDGAVVHEAKVATEVEAMPRRYGGSRVRWHVWRSRPGRSRPGSMAACTGPVLR